jgi:predicted AAA+ superfamily ATPase
MYKRKLFQELVVHLSKKEFSVITGARQTGKSTLLKQLEDHCKQNYIPVVLLNLENRSILSDLSQSPVNVLKYLPEADKRVIILIDEVQYLKDASNFLKFLYDEHADRIKIVATGSSAFYIDDHFRDSLAGRKRLFVLLTCSFDEYLEITEKTHLKHELNEINRNREYKSTLLDYLRIEWEKYILFGGYPAIITEPDEEEKINKLKEIRDSFIKRDILESGVQNEIAFYNLFRILADQTGNLVNVNELSSLLRIKNETVASYLHIMQKCYHIALIRPFFRNLRKELIRMPKVFLLDSGLRNCLLNNFQPFSSRMDTGQVYENAVFRILAEKYGLDTVKFWRTSAGNEVDFVFADVANPYAIEVKYDSNQVKSGKYKLFNEAYPEIPLQFSWMNPFNEDFFRRIGSL